MSSSQEKDVFIRKACAEDCEAFVAAVRRSRKLHGSWILPKARNEAEFADYLLRFAPDKHSRHLVIHRESGGIVGVININEIIRGAFQSGSLGYYAFEPYAGQGLMSAGMRLVLQHAFRELKLHRLEANIQPANAASVALVQQCGFVKEGFSPRLLKVKGRWRDHERWALLAENFKRNPIGSTKKPQS